MQNRVSHAAKAAAVRPYDRGNAMVIGRVATRFAHVATVLAFIVTAAGCRPGSPARLSRCRAMEGAQAECAACDRPTTLTASEAERLAREVLARAISADREARVFNGAPHGPRYYRVNGGRMYIPGVETTERIDDLNPLAKAAPWKDVVFVDIDVLGASGRDAIYVRVTVTPRSWMPDYDRFGDDPGIGTYCLRLVGDTVQVTVITPPIYLS